MAVEISDLIELYSLASSMPKSKRHRLLFIGETKIYPNLMDISRVIPNEHGVTYSKQEVSAKALGKLLGFEIVETLGIEGNVDHKFNLMDKCPDYLKERFDLIFDSGVTYWTFNPGTAMTNYAKMLKMKGIVVHTTAVSGFYGSAYYNIHPVLLDKFYSSNGFELRRAALRQRRSEHDFRHIFKIVNTRIFKRSFRSEYKTLPLPFMADPKKLLASRQGYFVRKIFRLNPELKNNVLGLFAYQKIDARDITAPILFETSILKSETK